MFRVLALLLAAIAATAATAANTAAAEPPPSAVGVLPESPQMRYPELYAAVEDSRLLGDSKRFADAIPLEAPDEIGAAFRIEHPDTPEALRAFVARHFTLAEQSPAASGLADGLPITQHIDRLWAVLTRRSAQLRPYDTLIPLPDPYVVPGGRFRELYYWDSYFTMLGLAESGRRDLLKAMVRDFAHLIDTYGHIPNGTRSYYLSRSQPPFFFEMVELLGGSDPVGAAARFLPELRREHAYWMAGEHGLAPGSADRRVVALPDGALLNRYWDDRDLPRDESYVEDTALARASGREPHQLYRDLRAAAESGWDFSSRWLADGRSLASIDTTELIPVDLNSLLYGLEQTIGAACQRRHDQACMREFRRRATARRRAMDRYLWNPAAQAYLDFRWTSGAASPRLSAATLYPLFVGLASAAQAATVARTIRNQLLAPGGLATTTLVTPQQWDAPNGWAPLQWIAVLGLRRYGERDLARTIAARWIRTVELSYAQTGKLVEKYDVLTPGRGGGGGEYPLQDGFGWTNGVMRKLLKLYGSPSARRTYNKVSG